MEACRPLRAFVASGLLCAFLLALAFAVAPQLHARIHPDANVPGHECAVALIATGKFEQGHAPLAVPAPQPAVLCEKVPALPTVWVAAPFLGSAIFEHAPPAFA